MTFLSPDTVNRRYGRHLPGLRLLNVLDAAIPVTKLAVDVMAQERTPLPLLDEFVLRFVNGGIRDIAGLAAVLGLEQEQVLAGAALQIDQNTLRNRGFGELELTELGREVVTDAEAVRPVLTQLPVVFDRILWRITEYSEVDLIKKKDAEEAGMVLLPAKQNTRVALEEVTVDQLNKLIGSQKRGVRSMDVLRVRRIASQNQFRYLPVQLLVYGNPNTGDMGLELCIDGALSQEHESSLSGDAADKLGISIAEPASRPMLSAELEAQRVSHDEVENLKTAESPGTGTAGVRRVDELLVRSLSVFEHREYLEQGLTSSVKRLLIISPWIRNAIVNTDFLAKLERRLKSGVEVHIGYGIGRDDKDSDSQALDRLANLANRYQDNFRLVRLRNSHAKILIFDNVWINTSFNWLSFKGDPDRTMRMEEGTLVQIPAQVDMMYEKYVRVLSEDAARP